SKLSVPSSLISIKPLNPLLVVVNSPISSSSKEPEMLPMLIPVRPSPYPCDDARAAPALWAKATPPSSPLLSISRNCTPALSVGYAANSVAPVKPVRVNKVRPPTEPDAAYDPLKLIGAEGTVPLLLTSSKPLLRVLTPSTFISPPTASGVLTP